MANVLAVALPIVAGLGLIALASFVLRTGRRHRHNVVFAALYFLSGVKSLSDGLVHVADSFHANAPLFPDAAQWQRFGLLCAFWMVPLLVAFVARFPRPVGGFLRSRSGTLALLAPSLILSLALLFVPREVGVVVPPVLATPFLLFNVVATAVTIGAVVYLLRARRGASGVERKQATYVVVGWLPAFLATWFITLVVVGHAWFPGVLDQAAWDALLAFIGPVVAYYSPVLELVAAAFVAYALLKYAILGIELKVKFGVKSLVFGGMVVLIFLVTQFIENVILQGQLFAFAGDYGSFVLSGVSSILLFKPIEKLSSLVSNRLFPDTAQKDYATTRGEEIYLAQVTYVLRDANVTERERAFLANLRQEMGIAPERARAIEEEVERRLGVDHAATGASAGPTAGPGSLSAQDASGKKPDSATLVSTGTGRGRGGGEGSEPRAPSDPVGDTSSPGDRASPP